VESEEHFDMAKKSSKASFLPVLVAVLALILSIVIYLLTRSVAHAFTLHLIGYVLTPLCVALSMGWDTIAQRRGKGNDQWFEQNATYSRILRVLTGVSFLVAFPHIYAMATDIAEKIAS
jgi:hypothetical protein